MTFDDLHLEFLKAEALLVIDAGRAGALLAFHRHLDAIRTQMLALGASRLLVDASGIKADIASTDIVELLRDDDWNTPAVQPLRIAGVVDPSHLRMNLVFSLLFNRGHCVAMFGDRRSAAEWLASDKDLSRSCLARGARTLGWKC
jgi:hypothetical protein